MKNGRNREINIPRRLRISAAGPPWVKETLVKLRMDPAHGMAAADLAKACVAAVEGSYQGKILDPGSSADSAGR